MNIIDLTQGAYPGFVEWCKGYEDRYSNKRWTAAAFSSDFRIMFNNTKPNVDFLMNSVPVFLVDKGISETDVPLPGCHRIIHVPNDKKLVPVEPNNPQKKTIDILGLYEHDNSRDFLPRRIFVWIDKIGDCPLEHIEKCIEKHPKCLFKLDEMAKALFDVVLTHERGHALMDVELYGETPSPQFTYDMYYYFFIEEAYANAYALTTTMKKFNDSQKKFIKLFVDNQPNGYKDGWKLYEDGCYNYSQWMIIKSKKHFTSKKQLLDVFWKTKDFSVLSR